MSFSTLLKYLFQWLFLFILQIFVLQKVYLTEYCVPFVYSMFLLTLPVNTNRYLVLLLGFFTGMIYDWFYHTGGIHTASFTAIAYLRYYWLKLVEPPDEYEENQIPVLAEMNLSWFLKYTLPMVVMHHFLLFLIEAFEWRYLIDIFIRTILSSIAAEVIIYFIHQLFFRPKQT